MTAACASIGWPDAIAFLGICLVAAVLIVAGR